MLNYKKPAFLIIIISVIACIAAAVFLLTDPVSEASFSSGVYKVTDSIYIDGVFSYYMNVEKAPLIEIDKNMYVQEWYTDYPEHGVLFKESSLTNDNFDSLFNGMPMWTDGRDKDGFKSSIKKVFVPDEFGNENGITPYMLLQDSSEKIYIIYANTENGAPTCIRWIYSMEKTDISADNISDVITDTSSSEPADDIDASEPASPSFDATVLEVNEGSLLVRPDENSVESKSSDKIYISLSGFDSDALPKVNAGDKVRIIYDGNIAESYPAQINKAYAVYSFD